MNQSRLNAPFFSSFKEHLLEKNDLNCKTLLKILINTLDETIQISHLITQDNSARYINCFIFYFSNRIIIYIRNM